MGIIARTFESRASEADLINNPSAFFAAIFGEGPSNDAGINVSPETALTYGPILAGIRIIAEPIAQVPWNVMRLSTDGKSSEIATDRPEYALLKRSPDPRMTSFTFRHSLVMNAIMGGGGFAEIVRNGAQKTDRFRFIPTSSVTILESKSGDDLYYEITRKNGSKDRVHMSDMIHIPTLAVDGVTGKSLLRQFTQGIAIGMAAEKFGAAYIGKGTRPSGILYSETPLKNEQRNDIAEWWQKSFGGAGKAGSTPVVSGVKWQPIQGSLVDAQYQAIREFQVAEVGRVLKIPGIFLGIKETSTYASAVQHFLSLVKLAIAPWAEAIEQEFDRKLFPKDMTLYTHLDLRGLMRGDEQARSSYYKTLFDMGALTSNDVRAEEELNPLENGDRAYVQQALMPTDLVDEVLKAKAQPAPVTVPAVGDAQQKSRDVHMRWLETVVERMRSWKTLEKPKAIEALKPVFRSWCDGSSVDVDAFCREIAELDLDGSFVLRAVTKFDEVCHV
jgi:HK97 family phage portal protein